MSLAFDEYGRPFIIIRVRARGRRVIRPASSLDSLSALRPSLFSPASSAAFCAYVWLNNFDLRRSERDAASEWA